MIVSLRSGFGMNPHPATSLRGLYLITPDEQDTGRLLARVEPLLDAGVTLLQLRNKRGPASLLRRQALALLPACRTRRIPLLINDDWRMAADVGADGVHLGQRDGSIERARAALGPSAIIGATCHASLELAARAAAEGADYLAFGAMFGSSTKPDAPGAPMSVLREAARFGLPVVAIGGITTDNARRAIAAGADLLGVIGAVFDAADPVARVRDFHSLFAEPR